MRLGPLFTSWEGTEEAVNAGVEEIGAQDRSGKNLHELVARLDSRFETMSCYYVATVAASTVPPTLKASCPLSSFSEGSVPRYELYQHGSYGGAPPRHTADLRSVWTAAVRPSARRSPVTS